MIEKREKISIQNYIFVWIGFLLAVIIIPVIIWGIYKLLNLKFEINLDTVFAYIGSCLTFLGPLSLTLSSAYLTKKNHLEQILNTNKILITEGKNKEISLKADEQNTLTLMFNVQMQNFIFPDEVIVKKLSINSAANIEEKCVITNNNQEVIAFSYPRSDGQTLISLYMDKKAPSLAYKLIDDNKKLSIDVTFDMIKTNVVTSVMYCADIIKKKQPNGIYTHQLAHPTLIFINKPYFYNQD